MDLLSDIDNALRQDQAKALWEKYGSAAITALLAVLFLIAVYQGYQSWAHGRNAAHTDALLAALQADDATKITSFAQEASGVHLVIARIAEVAREKDVAKRVAQFKAIAEDSSASRDFRDLATIMMLRETPIEKTDDAQTQAEKLQKIAKDKHAAFAHLARLDLAALQARHLKDLSAARETLKPVLEAEEPPPDLAYQARALDAVYAAEQEQK